MFVNLIPSGRFRKTCQKISYFGKNCRNNVCFIYSRRFCVSCSSAASAKESASSEQPSSSSCFGKGKLVNVTRVSLTDFEKLGIQVDRSWRFLLPSRKNESVLSTVIASMTFILIGQPIVGVDSTLTWLVIGIVLGIWGLDNISLNGTVTNFCSGIFQNKQRVAVHEAGHFLTAYLLGVKIQSYSIDVWTALKQGRASSGVLFNQEDVLKLLKYNRSYVVLIWLAGIAAEVLVFGLAEGGSRDIDQIKLLMKPDEVQDFDQFVKRVIYQAMECIRRHSKTFESLQKAMLRNDSVEKCFMEIERNTRLDSTRLDMMVGNSNQ
ncbi:Sarcosine/dimethylglycine N-methyltransferase [Galdieria sulphuraria]|nr:Sarcosine/dimethylglycine N-methyltransferase [Galdieria sulphuraria]